MNSMKRQNDRTPKDELLRSIGAPYANSGDITPERRDGVKEKKKKKK